MMVIRLKSDGIGETFAYSARVRPKDAVLVLRCVVAPNFDPFRLQHCPRLAAAMAATAGEM